MGYDPLDEFGFPISSLEELDRLNGPRFGRVGSIPQDILDKVAADGAAYRKNNGDLFARRPKHEATK